MPVQFTSGARRVVVVANEEAKLLGHDVLGTGHLLLGLLVADDDGFAANLLWGCDLTVDLVREKVAELSEPPPAPGAAPSAFSDRAKRTFEWALLTASDQGGLAGPDHLLLGIIALGEGVAVQVLQASGVDLDHLEAALADGRGFPPVSGSSPGGDDRGEEAGLVAMVRAGAAARAEIGHSAVPLSAARLEELRQQVAAGERAWEELLARLTPLVEDLARRYRAPGVPMDELMAAGTKGVGRAVSRFDAERGFKLSSYATWWVRQAITERVVGAN